MRKHDDNEQGINNDYFSDAKHEWITNRLEFIGDDETTHYADLSAEYDDLYNQSAWFGDVSCEIDTWDVVGKTKFQIFSETIRASQEIIDIQLTHSSLLNLYVMLHANVVAAIESYLSSTFIDLALSSQAYMRNIVENDPVLAKRTFSLKDLYITSEGISEVVVKYLKELIFHDMSKIKPMYKTTFDIDFGDIGWLYSAVNLRHHCVHRAGYDKDGNRLGLDEDKITELMIRSVEFVTFIEGKVSRLRCA